MLEELFNNLENEACVSLFTPAFEVTRDSQETYYYTLQSQGSSYTQCPQMALVFGIEVSFDNTSHKFTFLNFIQGSRNIYMTASTR
jgi:hypothetical protein